MDALFINPPSPDGYVYIRDINRSGRRSREHTIWPQTSLAYLAAVAKKTGLTVALKDCIAEGITWPELKHYIEDHKPKYILTLAISSTISNDLLTAYYGKTIGAYTIAIGPHVTHFPIETLTRYPCVDYCILGEAEATLEELLLCLEGGGDISTIQGLAYRQENNKIRVTEHREFITDLDSLPIPLHELLPIKKYCLPYIGNQYTFVLASRGCPYPCIFCRQIIMWEGKVRTRSAESIFSELKYLNDLGISNIMFHADTFTINRALTIKLCQMIIENGIHIKWCCNSRVDTVDEELLTYMKKAGCWIILYGIESGSDTILMRARKGGSASVTAAEKAIFLTKKAGIKAWGYFMIGLPGENNDTVRETIALSKKLPLDIVNFSVAAPYPGTQFYNLVTEKGWLTTNNWERFDQNYSAIVNYPDFSSEQIISSIRKAYFSWYMRPYGIIKLIQGISRLSDIKILLKIALSHLSIKKE